MKTRHLLVLLAVPILIFLWWTRYQHIGFIEVGTTSGPVLIDRFTGKGWVVSIFKWKEIKQEEAVSSKTNEKNMNLEAFWKKVLRDPEFQALDASKKWKVFEGWYRENIDETYK